MPSIFLKNDLGGIFNSLTETDILNDTNKNNSDIKNIRDNISSLNGGNKLNSYNLLSQTSEMESDMNEQILSDTSMTNNMLSDTNIFNHNNLSNTITSTDNIDTKDITKLLSMLTSETSDSYINSKNQSKMQYNNMNGGSNLNINDIRQFFYNLQSQGVDVNVKLNDKTMSDFFNLANNTTTELSNIFTGGSKSNIESNKESMTPFQAFIELKNHIANKLNIPKGPQAGKIASAVQQETKQRFPNITKHNEILKKAKAHFEDNISKFSKMIESNSKHKSKPKSN